MTHRSAADLYLRAACTLVLALGWLDRAHASDSYAGGLLTVPTLEVGPLTFSNVVLQVGAIVVPPNGTSANTNVDTYSTLNRQLTAPTVTSAGLFYYNTTATVKSLVSAGSVSGGDTYSKQQLTLPAVQAGAAIYTQVVITVGTIISYGGGMPQNTVDTYDTASRQLTMAAVQVGNAVYTNAVITPGKILSIGGQLPVESSSYAFGGYTPGGTADGAGPQAALVVGSDGNLYGTTSSGGANNAGTVFRLTPAGQETVLHTFGSAGDGASPYAGLTEDAAGNLYGTTTIGGANGQGAIFKVAAATGAESLVYSFGASSTDGTVPYGGLLIDSSGNLYGTTTGGGPNGAGTVFAVNPATGVETVVYAFSGLKDGSAPYAGLTGASDGNLYGTTSAGGANGNGTVFRLTPGATGGAFTTLYSFGSGGGNDGSGPESRLTLGRDGNFYGTTPQGGDYNGGTVFMITPAGAESVVHSFSGAGYLAGSTDGATPYAGLTLGSNGRLYGTTIAGGAYGTGSVFQVTPGVGGGAGTELLLYSFTGDNGSGAGPAIGGSLDGASPYGALVETANGDFYGTTFAGGSETGGVVFRLTDLLTAH